MRLVIIVNDYAGHGRAKRKFEKLSKTLQTPYILERTNATGHAVEIAKKYGELQEPTLLLTIGGDGTIHEVIKGAVSYEHLVVGVMNGGSGNDFGRAFPTFTTAHQIESFIQNPTSLPYDLGAVKSVDVEDVFMNNCGFGFDAVVTYEVNRSKMKAWLNKISLGKLAYVWILIRELFRFKPFDLTIENHGHLKNCYFVVASNQPYFGGGMKISPNSISNDGLMELTVVHDITKLKLLLIFLTVFFGKHTKFNTVKSYKSSKFDIRLHDSVIGHADGEYIGQAKENQTISYFVQENNWRLGYNNLTK
ncbi:putative lipid kinase YtlR [Kurthia zopfii]|uniref:Lipid kinase YtlR n=1 Tax=Kurthia zopfii TaxID=1650 RepID=A0A2U3ABL8_9BACL|nr:YegS/Rv2252/BmrU family lipid kinase [Kurthia zopfii]PWI21932.1 hypothetical protein DF281_09750 [Kurthia zopfii]TDR36306.1 YegS/Rv2252/BmrU family lipid kinase [Kurthia zopfii]STX10343.1 Putative lipid kinase YtlR [Kurthia zopfii]VEI08487.1 Putative lipid kinase YtlR [Kurthia zopfii]GEK31949.1 putative lipid kinase YtlR [Kurthia zopfii]